MDILETLFNELNENDIDYFVIGDYFDLPDYTGRTDLDLYINCSAFDEFYSIFSKNNKLFNGRIVSFFKSNNCFHLRIIGFYTKWWGLQIDIINDKFEFLTKEYFPLNVLKDNVILHNKIKVVDFRIGYFEGFIKEIIHKQKVKEKYFLTCKYMIRNDKYVLRNAIMPIYGVDFWDTLYDEFNNQEFNYGKISDLISKRLFRYKFLRYYYSLKKIKFLKRIIQKPGFTICFLGTDGAGKSTIIDHVTNTLKKAFHNTVYYEHLRPNYFPSLATLFSRKDISEEPVTNPHSIGQSSSVGSLLRLVYYLFDYTLGYYIKIFPKKAFKSSVWIFDRYYYDYYIDQRRSAINLPGWIIRFGQVFIPEPDIIICLGTDPEIIHARKPELSIQEVERQVNALKKFENKHKRAVWVDTGTNIEASSNTTLSYIVEHMSGRFENINLF